eukprot:4322161-Pyramimonas_sp.AAC.1
MCIRDSSVSLFPASRAGRRPVIRCPLHAILFGVEPGGEVRRCGRRPSPSHFPPSLAADSCLTVGRRP